MTLRPCRLFFALFAVAALPIGAHAGSLRGTVFFPPDPAPTELRPLANWRVENGVLPIAPAITDARTDAIVILEPAVAADPNDPQTKAHVTIEARGLRLDPRVAAAQVGTTFDFKNDDRAPRRLYLKGAEAFMRPEATQPGETRSVRFSATGTWNVRDVEFARAGATLVVVATPYIARVDDKGAFKLDAPDGKYTLKVFFRGAWAASQPVEVGRAGGEAQVKLAPADAPAQK